LVISVDDDQDYTSLLFSVGDALNRLTIFELIFTPTDYKFIFLIKNIGAAV